MILLWEISKIKNNVWDIIYNMYIVLLNNKY